MPNSFPIHSPAESFAMPLLDKLTYLRLMTVGAHKIQPTEVESSAVLRSVEALLQGLGLKPRTLKPADIVVVYQHGANRFFHLKAFPRRQPNTFVIFIVRPDAQPEGHILLDLVAEYAAARLDAPSADWDDRATAEAIESAIHHIAPDDDNPFAILSMADGTFLQTLCTDDGFLLEYQLVNTANHYKATRTLTASEVVAAMKSSAFGKEEWMESVTWQHEHLA